MPRQLGLDRATLAAGGFEGKVGQTLVVPRKDGPSVVAVGTGDPADLDAAGLRDAAAAFGRATGKHAHVATTLADIGGVDAEAAGRAVVEGLLLSRYRYGVLKKEAPGVDAGGRDARGICPSGARRPGRSRARPHRRHGGPAGS